MTQIKEALTNGYIVVFGTYILSWQGQLIMDDPATTDDDPEVGKAIGYFVNGQSGSHAMIFVGYNDAIWADVNGNAVVDPGEKGAFKIVNSWGSSWQDGGFIWLAYDALREVSAVPDGPLGREDPGVPAKRGLRHDVPGWIFSLDGRRVHRQSCQAGADGHHPGPVQYCGRGPLRGMVPDGPGLAGGGLRL